MKSSNSSPLNALPGRATLNWAKAICRVAAVAALAFVLPNPAQAQPTLLVRFPFTDTNSSTICASDTSTGGSNATLQMVSNNGVAVNYHGAPGSGVSGLGVALNFASAADFSVGAGEGSIAGNGPMAATTNAALNFGVMHAFTATVWANANALSAPGASILGPRIFILGANGTTDKGAANSVGLFWQDANRVDATINGTTITVPALGTSSVPTNQWNFYAITYDGTTATVYSGTDGTAATAAVAQSLANATITLNNANGSDLFIGNRPGFARPFDGWINDFRFYTNAASASFVEDIRWSAVVPTNVVGTLVGGQAFITWSPVAGAASYNISSSTTSGGPYSLLASGVSATNYTDATVLAPDTSYYYVVAAVNSAGDQTTTSNSAQASVPPAPVAVIGTLEDGGVGLYWNDTDVASYTILRATSPGGPFVAIATGITGTSYTDTNVTTGVQIYYYEVIGVNANGQTVPSSPAAVTYGQGNQLADPGFEQFTTPGPWAEQGNQGGNGVTSTILGYTYYNAGACPPDAQAEQVVSHSGTNVGKIYGDFNSAALYISSYKQSVSATPLGTWTAGAWTMAPHEDLMTAPNWFYYEVDFLDISGNLLASYESFVLTNLSCGGPNTFPLDTWVFLATTNQMLVSNGVNTGTVIGNTGPSGIMTAPVGTTSVAFNVLYNQINYGGGSIYFDDCELDLVNGSLPPTLSLANLNNLTLCTNTSLTGVAVSTGGTITNVVAILKTSSLSSTISTTVTNNINSSTTGIGTSTATINYPLTTNVIYNVTVVATDNKGNNVSATENFDTISPTLVIEATDFNFETNGGGGGFIDTPPNGGLFLYTNQYGFQGIDENKVGNQSTHVAYRMNDSVVIQNAGSTTFNEQKYAVAGATELCVDYTTVGDWLNYTRTYGPGGSAPAGTYDVYLCMGTDGAGAQTALYEISGDPTTQQQTTNYLGQFGTASFSEQNWAGYEYVPLTDQYGNLVSTTIPSGPQTLRIQQNFANPNLEYLMLMPAAQVLTPGFKNYYPDGVHPFEGTNHFAFTVGPNNGSNIASSGIDLVLNGVDVTSNPAFSLVQGAGGVWTGSYPIQSNALYTASVNVTNTAGLSSSLSITFDTFSINNYQWEAVDYDFSTNNNTSSPPAQGSEFGPGWISGLFIDNPKPTADFTATTGTGPIGEEETNSYFGYPIGWTSSVDPFGAGAIAQQGIDIGWVNVGGQTMLYRHDNVGSQPSTDYVRPKFLAAQTNLSDPNIGPFNIGYYTTGSWLNYTRHYPTNNYYIWGRLAGGAGPFSGTTVSLVTSGVGSATQTTQLLGTFSDPNAAGWQTYHWIPLLDTNGNMVDIQLGGLATLKVTSGNNINMEFFMLAPAPIQLKVTPSLVGGLLNLSFPTETGHNYTVVYKSVLTAPTWTPVGSVIPGNGSVTNVTESLTGTQGYYTVTVQ